MNAVSKREFWSSFSCQTLELQSSLVKNFDWLTSANRFSILGRGYVSPTTLSWSFVRSTHIRILPLGLGTTAMSARQSAVMSTLEITPNFSILSSSSLTFFMRGSATLLGVVSAKGVEPGFNLKSIHETLTIPFPPMLWRLVRVEQLFHKLYSILFWILLPTLPNL